MKRINLTNGGVTQISDKDHKNVSKFKWFLHRGADNKDYVKRTKDEAPLSRFIMNPEKGMIVDHIDGNTLNNTRENLRICTPAENSRNSILYETNTSGFRGVVWRKEDKKWSARITVNYKRKFLGNYESIVDAAKAYNEAARKYHGEFAKLNYIDENKDGGD